MTAREDKVEAAVKAMRWLLACHDEGVALTDTHWRVVSARADDVLFTYRGDAITSPTEEQPDAC